MAWDAADWTITRADGNIRYIGDAHDGTAPTYVTGIDFHRALMDFADESTDTSSDDQLAIIDNVPSQRGGVDTNITLLNSFNIDQTASEHLYDTSISQLDGAEIYDGIQVFGNSTSIQVIQDGALLTPDFWNEPKMITAVEDTASSTTHRFLVQVRTGSADIDARRLLGTQRVYGTVYTEFFIGGGTNRGNNVLALTANNDLNNDKAEGVVAIAPFDTVVNDNEGYTAIDANFDLTDEYYYSDWTTGTVSKNDFYERGKWIQREGTSYTIYGLNGDLFRGITHEIDIDTGGTNTWVEPESLSWGTGATAGTGQLLAVDNTTASATTKLWLQVLSGVAPNLNLITGAGTGTGTATATTPRLVSLPFIGASTGAAIIGAYGLGIQYDDLEVADSVTSLDGNPLNPPNNVQFNVTGLDITGGEEDYVLVGSEAGGILDLNFDTVVGPINGNGVTEIVVTTAIPLDTPASGTIRIENDEGMYVRIPYSSYTASTYTIPAYNFDGSGDNDSVANGNSYFISYIDKQAASASEGVTVIYQASPLNVVVRVRNGNTGTPAVNPIVPFEAVAVIGAAGGSQAASRVLDL
jgi:hypothetical protein